MSRGAQLLAAAFFAVAGAIAPARADLLDYVKRPDAEFAWHEESARDVGGARVAELELVSQVWQGRPWRHRLRVTVPAESARADLAILEITGGSRGWIADEVEFAKATGATLAVLGDVPNQPLFGRSEDALIAYTFEQYLKTGSDEWPLLFPMTKAAVRAMDAVAALARRESGRELRFVVTGASKRGWTSWLAAVADSRVVGTAPAVFDNLRFGAQMKNQLAVWREYSPELGDYSERGLQALMETERGRKLVAMVDPYAYRDSLARVAKFLIGGTNDPYWELDAVNFYWNDLPGPKSLLYVPNAGHDAASDPRAAKTLAAFARRLGSGRGLPDVECREAGGTRFEIRTSEPAVAARVWSARSETRDFRGARWRSLEARREGDRFVADLAEPARGFVARFGEAAFHGADGDFTVSTPVVIARVDRDSGGEAAERRE